MEQQLHPPFPLGEGLVLRCGRGGLTPRQNHSVLREILPEFGRPSSSSIMPEPEGDNSNNPMPMRLRSNSVNGQIISQHQHSPLEMSMPYYGNNDNMDPSYRGVPFESHQYMPQHRMPYNLYPPPPRFHANQQRRFGPCGRPPRYSRPWHQRRHHNSHPQNGGGLRPPPPHLDYFYGHPNNLDGIHPRPHNLQFMGELENRHHEEEDAAFRERIPVARRHSDPLFYALREGERLPLSQMMVSSDYRELPHYFNDSNNNPNEEYVPQELSVSRVRRVRLASLETLPDSNSSNNSLLGEESDSPDKDCEELEDGDVFDTVTPTPEDTLNCSPKIATAYVASVTKYVLVGKQKTELRAAFGVWAGIGHETSNFGGLVPQTRPQCHKAALIAAGAQCVNSLKGKGFDQVNISESENYLVNNITMWLNKANAENGFVLSEASNWDEFKYSEEIGKLCESLDGMKINWVLLTGKCDGMEQAKRLARAAFPKDYIVESPAED